MFLSKSSLKSEASLALPRYKLGKISTAPFLTFESLNGLLGAQVFSGLASSLVMRRSDKRMYDGPLWSASSDSQRLG